VVGTYRHDNLLPGAIGHPAAGVTFATPPGDEAGGDIRTVVQAPVGAVSVAAFAAAGGDSTRESIHSGVDGNASPAATAGAEISGYLAVRSDASGPVQPTRHQPNAAARAAAVVTPSHRVGIGRYATVNRERAGNGQLNGSAASLRGPVVAATTAPEFHRLRFRIVGHTARPSPRSAALAAVSCAGSIAAS